MKGGCTETARRKNAPFVYFAGQAELKTAWEPRVPYVRVGQPGGLAKRPRPAGEAKGHRDGVMSTLLVP